MRRSGTLAFIVVTTLLGGCSWFQFPGVYKLEIQQGNILTQDMVEQLETGMTRQQVNYVLGTPLIQDPFQQDRWDYYYSLQDEDGESYTEHLTVHFENDQLSRLEGDLEPRGPRGMGDEVGEDESPAEPEVLDPIELGEDPVEP